MGQIEQREDAPLPIGVEYRLVRFAFDRSEALHSAQIMDPVHRCSPAVLKL
jgi:hypothetical protein